MADDYPTRVAEPLLEQTSQYEQERDRMLRGLRDGKQGLLAAATSQSGLSYARTRSLLLKKRRRAEDEAHDSWLEWPKAQLREFSREKLPVLLPMKAGLAALIASLLCFAPGVLSVFNKNGVWAVITVDIVMETNVGLSFSKGLNRTLGTLMASFLALSIDYLGDYLGSYEKYLIFICTFLGGAIPTMFKFRRPFTDRWNYAVVMSMITFHLLILTQSDEKKKLPILRLALIAIGFVVASLVNLFVLPIFAGNNVNDLLATNFERAGNVIEKCVLEYCQGTVLQQLPEVLNHVANDELHSCFHEILAADSEVEKLLKAARFEPPHDKFFLGYPWRLYRDVAENLRFAYYDVVALDSCLRAEIQAPLHLRAMFRTEFLALGKECAELFRTLGKTMRHMKKHDIHQVLERAEEIAILFQHKIARQTEQLLQVTHSESTAFVDNGGIHLLDIFREVLGARSTLSESNEAEKTSGQRSDVSEMTLPELHHESAKEIEERQKKIAEKKPTLEGRGGEFLKRRASIGHHWETTVQRLAALSLLKFASLLIEIAAKGKYVVGVVDELAERARFDKAAPGHTRPSEEFASAFATLLIVILPVHPLYPIATSAQECFPSWKRGFLFSISVICFLKIAYACTPVEGDLQQAPASLYWRYLFTSSVYR